MKKNIVPAMLLAAVLPALPCHAAAPQIAESDSVRAPHVLVVKQYSPSGALPAGAVLPWPAASPIPEGWLECDGGSFDSRYGALRLALNSTRLPDYRGIFLRAAGGNAAAIGVLQEAAIKAHTHMFPALANSLLLQNAGSRTFSANVAGGAEIFGRQFTVPSGGSIDMLSGDASPLNASSAPGTIEAPEGSSENARPENVPVRWIIRTGPLDG